MRLTRRAVVLGLSSTGAAVALGLSSTGAARAAWPGSGKVYPGPGPVVFAGPGDVVSGATMALSLRAYTKAIADAGTQAAVNIRRASDNATTDILILPSGDLDVATAAAFSAATTCFVTTWYDQCGNGNHAFQATPANQPQFMLSGGSKSGLPYVAFNGTTAFLATTNNIVLTQPYSFSIVAERSGAFTSVGTILRSASTGARIEFAASANTMTIFTGAFGDISGISDSVWHAIQGVFRGSTSVFNLDGTPIPTATISGGASGTNGIMRIGSATGSAFLTGGVEELIIYPAAETTLHANQTAYWGTP